MTIYLRQSTASQEIPLGYFLDSTDGNTEETALSIANTDIKIWKAGATTVANKNSGGATHISNGIYYCVLDATDTNTLGPIVLFTHVAGALVVRVEGVVLSANIYDSMIAGTDLFNVSVTQWTGTNVATPDTAGYPKVTMKSGTGTGEINLSSGNLAGSVASVTGAVGSVTGAVGSVTGNVGGNVTGTVGSVVAGVNLSVAEGGFLTSAGVTSATGTTITLGGLGTSSTNDFYVGDVIYITANTGAGQMRVVTAYNGTTKVATIDRAWITNPDATSTYSIKPNSLAKTNSSLEVVSASVTGSVGSVTGAVGSVTGSVGSVTGSVGSVTGSVGSVTGAVGSVTGNVGGNVTGSVGSVTTGGITSASFAAGAITATSIASDAITAAKIATGAIDADALATDAVSEIADGVWDELLSGHAVSGSTGEALSAAGTAGDPWTTSLPGAYSAGQAGYIIGTNLDATVASRLAPTTAGRTLDVTTTGEAGIDWANIGSPTTSVNLSGTTISTSQVVASVSGAVGSVTGSVGSVTGAVGSVTGNVGGNVVGSVASVTGNIGGNVVGSVASVVGAVGSVTGNVGGNVTGTVGSVVAGVNLSVAEGGFLTSAGVTSATGTTITLGGLGTSSTNDFYVGDVIYITANTGAGQMRVVTAYNGTTKVATIDRAWITNPDATSTYSIKPNSLAKTNSSLEVVSASVTGAVGSVTGAVGSVTGAVGSVTGNVGGNVTGTVGSVVGAVGSVTGAVGSVTGNVGGNIVGSVASVTGNVGGNVSGNVTGSVGSIATGGITSSSFAASAIDASAIASNAITAAKIATGAIDADALATDAVSEIADGVWDELLSGHAVSGSTGEALSAAGTAGDPWTTALPGAYSAGQAGYIIGTNLDATVASRLAPTTAGRTLDVTATGEAGIDWGNVGSPTASVNLSGTTISTSQVIASVSGAVGSVTGSVGSVTGSVGSVTGAVGSVTGNVGGNVVGSVASVTGNVGGNVVGSVASVVGAVGSVTGNIGGNVVGSVASVTAAVTLLAKDSPSIRNNTAQAGAAGTITLDASASATTDFYVGTQIKIDSGTGSGQVRVITAYNGTTKVATVDHNWATNPDNTSIFTVLATDSAKLDSSLQITVGGYASGQVPLQPTVAGRTLDVTATGAGGIDWANIENPTTSVNLSATNIDVDQVVASVSGAVGSVTGAVGSVTGNVGGNVTGSVGSIASGGIAAASFAASAITATSIASDAITAAKIATGAIDADALATDAVSEIADGVWDELLSGHAVSGSTGEALSAAGTAGDPWTTSLPGAYSAGQAGYIIGTNLDATVASRLAPTTAGRTLDVTTTGEAGIDWANIGSPTTSVALSGTTISTSQVVASVTGTVGSVTGAVGSVTGNVGGSVASVTGNVGGNVVGAVASVTGNVGGNVTGSIGSVASGGITALSIASDAITAAKIASDAVTEIQSGLATSSALSTAQTDIDDIQTRLPASLVGGRIDANIGAIASNTTVPTSLMNQLKIARTATVVAADTNQVTLDAGADSTTLDLYKGMWIGISAGVGVGQVRMITYYDETTQIAGVAPGWALQPDNTSTYVLIPAGGVDIQSIKTSTSAATSLADNIANLNATITSRLAPTTAGRTLDVTTTGEAGIDWGNIGSPTTSVNLSGTTISTSQVVASVTGAVGSVTGAVGSVTGNVGGNVVGSVASVVGAVGSVTGNVTGSVGSIATGGITSSSFAASAITATSIASSAITAAKFAADAIDSNAIAATGASEIAAAVWDQTTSGHTASGTFGQIIAPIRAGTAQAGAGSTITLDASASATDGFYNDLYVRITDGTGIGQIRLISGYTGSSKIANILPGWTTNPDNTSVFALIPNSWVDVGEWIGVFPNALISGRMDSTVGAYQSGLTPLQPTTAGRTLDVTATGEAGIDWGNIGAPTTTVNLSGTTVKTATDVETDTQDIQSRLPAALVSGRMSSDAVAISGSTIAADNVEANIANLDAAVSSRLATVGYTAPPSVGAIADQVWDEILSGHAVSGSTGEALSAAGASGDPWITTLPGSYTAGQAGYIVGTNVDALISSRLAPTTAGRTLDVTATGAAGVDWGNIENQATAVNLSATNIDVDQVVASVSGAVASVTGNVGGSVASVTGNVGGNVVGSVASVTGNVGGNVVGSVASVTGNIGGNVVGSVASVTAAVTLLAKDSDVIRNSTAQAGAGSSITLDASASATTDYYVGALVKLDSGTGLGQVRTITAYNGTSKVATVDRAWATNPDNTSVFTVAVADNPKTDSSLQVTASSVQGNVTGSVASVVGAVGSVTGSVGSVTGSVGSVTGNVGGNVTGSVGSIATGGIVAASFATDSITNTALAASAVTEIQSGLATSSALTNAQSDLDDIQTRLPAALVSGRIDVSVGAYQSGLAPLQPTTAGRTLDVTTTGEAGIDWANIGSPTTSVNLSGTTISTSQAIASVSGSVGSVTGSVGSVTGSVGSVTGNVGGSVASVTGNVGGNVVGSVASVTGNVGGNVVGSVASVIAAVTLNAKDTNAVRNSTAQAGASTTITLDASASATNDIYNGSLVKIDTGTGSGQTRIIVGYVGATKVATVDRAWVTNPDNTSVFTVVANEAAKLNSSLEVVAASVTGAVGSVSGAVGSVTGNVGGNVVGSVASVVGAVGSVTGNVGGNVVGSVASVTAVSAGAITSSSFAASAITATSIASSAITSTKFAADAIDSNALAASAVTEIQSGLATSSALTTVQADTDDIQSRLPAALVSGRLDVSVGAYQSGLTPLQPTTAGRTLDVTATGEAGIDWGNIGSPTTSVNLSGTTISTSQVVASVTGAVGSVTGAVGSVTGNVGGNVVGTVASVTGNVGGNVTGSVGSVATGGITSASFASGAIDAAAIATDAITSVELASSAVAEIAGAIWDETASSHVNSGSFGQVLQTTLRTGTAQAGSASTITLDAGANANNSFYNDQIIRISSGTGANQSRVISAYNGTSKVATVSSNWVVTPDNTSVFAIQVFGVSTASTPSAIASAVWEEATSSHVTAGTFGQSQQPVRSNTAQAGGSTTITLDSGANASDSYYNDTLILITGGTGAGQTRGITNYVGSTKVATVTSAWVTNPDNTSVFVIYPFAFGAASSPSTIASAVWDLSRTGHTNSGTFGEGVASVQGNVTGSVASVTGSVGSVTGSVGSVTGAVGSVTGSVGSVTGNVGGNVVGSVASVVGAVGSVTGNVGGNVVGSVASVTGNVGGNVSGSVASVTAPITLSAKDSYVIRNNTAQAGASSSITLDASASSVTDFYVGSLIKIDSATGIGQTRTITAYNGTSKVATVDRAWATNPDVTSVFSIMNSDNAKLNSSLEVISASVTGSVASVAGTVGSVTGSVGSIASGGIVAASFATDSITNTALATSAVTEIQSGLATSSALATVQSDTDDIQSRLPAALVGGRMASDAIAISGSTTAADNVEANIANLDATVSSRLASSSYTAAPTAADNADAVWDEARAGHVTAGSFGQGIASVQGNVTGSVASVTGAVGSVTAGVTVTTNNDKTNYELADGAISTAKFISGAITSAVLGASALNVIADQVWDEILSGHAVSGSTGEALTDAQSGGSAPTAADVADAVWDELRSGHVISGSFGQGVASVQGNITGSVASVTGAVGSVTGAVGSVTGNVSGSVASVTGNLGGNVVGSVASVTGNVGGNVVGSIGSLGATAKTDVNTEVDTALADIRLDELMENALTGNPAAGSLYGDLTQDNGVGVQQFTVTALENAPAGGGGTTDWTSTERAQIRFRLGLDGSVNTPAATSDLANGGDIDDVLAAVASVQSDTNDIQTRLPAALVSGRIASDAVAISGSTTAADNVEANIGNLDATVSTRALASTALSTTNWTNGRATALDNLNATITSRLASSSYVAPTTPPTVGDIADAVWDETISGHLTAGTTGNKLNSAASAGDPWGTALPGSYAAGEAGYILGNLSGGGGSGDWTNTELEQIRYRLGIDGASSVPSATSHLPYSGNTSGGGGSTGGTPLPSTSTQLNLYSAAAFEATITGADVSGVYTKLTFTAKLLTTQSLYARDSLIQITDDEGLKYLNSAAVDLGSASLGSLAVVDNTIVISLDEEITKELGENYGVKWDIKKTTTNGVNIIASGKMDIRTTLVG